MRPPASAKPPIPNTEGSRFRSALSAISWRSSNRSTSSSTNRAEARSRAIVVKARSMSSARRTSTGMVRRPSVRARVSLSFSVSPWDGLDWFQSTASRVRRGAASLSSSIRLPESSGEMRVSPVRLPPGRARLVTKPEATGSATTVMTTGMVLVACATARMAGVEPTTMTSTLRRTSSAARPGRRSSRPSAHRNSIAMLRPSTYPSSRRLRVNASALEFGGAPGCRKPTRGTLPAGCAPRSAKANSTESETTPRTRPMSFAPIVGAILPPFACRSVTPARAARSLSAHPDHQSPGDAGDGMATTTSSPPGTWPSSRMSWAFPACGIPAASSTTSTSTTCCGTSSGRSSSTRRSSRRARCRSLEGQALEVPSELCLAVRALGRDLPVMEREDVAALHLVARAAARGPRRQPLDRGQLRTGEVADLVPAHVGDPPEHVLEELADRRLADGARSPGILTERRFEDHVVGHHGEDPLDVVSVPHLIEPRYERLTVESHRHPRFTRERTGPPRHHGGLILAANPELVAGFRLVEHELLDDLIGLQQYRVRDRQPERLRGLEVDDQLELGRQLHGEVAWLCSLQDPVDIEVSVT